MSRQDEAIERLLTRAMRADAKPADACPDEAVLAAYVDGALVSEESRRLEQHVSSCSRCALIMATVLDAEPVAASQSPMPWWTWRAWIWAVPSATAVVVLGVWFSSTHPRPEVSPSSPSVSSPAELESRVEQKVTESARPDAATPPATAPATTATPTLASPRTEAPRQVTQPAPTSLAKKEASSATATPQEASAADVRDAQEVTFTLSGNLAESAKAAPAGPPQATPSAPPPPVPPPPPARSRAATAAAALAPPPTEPQPQVSEERALDDLQLLVREDQKQLAERSESAPERAVVDGAVPAPGGGAPAAARGRPGAGGGRGGGGGGGRGGAAGGRAANPTFSTGVEAGVASSDVTNARQQQLQQFAPIVLNGGPPGVRWRLVGTVIERSTDTGVTWAAEYDARVPLAAGAVAADGIVWCGGSNGLVVRRSQTGWSTVTAPAAVNIVAITEVSLNGATVMLADGRTFRTEDAGGSWRERAR